MSSSRAYHHGNLRQALIDDAITLIAERGLDALSLRELSRRLGVSHAAPAHHFAEKRDLFTAIATQGYEKLADGLEAASAAGGSFLDAGMAYVRFAVDHPVHLKLMFQPLLLREEDPALRHASQRTNEALYGSAGTVAPESSQMVGLAGWCLVHGFADLWLTGNLRNLGDDPIAAARQVARVTFRTPQ